MDSLAFERLGGAAVLRRPGAADLPLAGSDPAVGGPYVAVLSGEATRILSRATLAPVAEVPTPGADALAISQGWLAYRAKLSEGGDGIFVRSIATPGAYGALQTVATIGDPAQLSPPSLDGAVLLFGVARARGSRIVQRVLGTRKRRTLVKSGSALVFNPAVKGRSFAYVRTKAGRSRLMVRKRGKGGRGKPVLGVRRSRGMLTSTALTEGVAYVTLLHPSATDAGAEVLSAQLKKKKKAKEAKEAPLAPAGEGAVADPVARAGPQVRGPVAWVREPTAVQRQAAAADALRQPDPKALELGDALVDALGPLARQPRPVSAAGRPVRRQLGELGADLAQRQPDPLGEDDEGDPSQYRARVAPVTRAGALRGDQPPLLVEAQGGGRDAAAAGSLADGEQILHGRYRSRFRP